MSVMGVFRKAKTYAAAGALESDIDCIAESPTGKEPSLRIRIGTGGTVDLVFEDDSEGTVTYASGDVDDIAVKTVKSTSTAQQITLYWF